MTAFTIAQSGKIAKPIANYSATINKTDNTIAYFFAGSGRIHARWRVDRSDAIGKIANRIA
ncbi:hypothetical protein [Paenibacillus cymbidii]|uniref:hypothetical protein n=1 Tax=Paenibacillus cymbidii TaxID=1639034 RepID=UPI0010814377|nr:hypothetical protein [Paenibacillus cymbidii]